jgi:hypothetical protein
MELTLDFSVASSSVYLIQLSPQVKRDAIYKACDAAKLPRDLPDPAADRWRGLLIFAYVTGWRIGPLRLVRGRARP